MLVLLLVLLLVATCFFAWSLCRISARAYRDAANAWMDFVIEKPSDLYAPTVTKAEADEVSA